MDLINKIIEEKQNILITGSAGTGKSYTLNKIVKKCREDKINVAVTASTGTAAININGMTIHKFLSFNIQTNKEYVNIMSKKPFWFNVVANIRWSKIIIIDEISMISADQLDLIDAILKKATKSDKPFGGKFMIFVGDFLQLPPIGKNLKFAFESQSWKEAKIKTIYLKNNHRQVENNFISILEAIRIGDIDRKSEMQAILESLVIDSNQINDESTILMSRNKDVDEHNNKKIKELKTKEHCFESNFWGKTGEQLSKSVIAPNELIVKKGARIIMLINDPEDRFINGTQGHVLEIMENESNPIIQVGLDDGNIINVSKHVWNQKNLNDETTGSFEQFPIKLAWAITIHKSQGATIEKLHIDFSNMFAEAQMYVALSRARTLEKLTISNLRNAKILVNKTAKEFYSNSNKK